MTVSHNLLVLAMSAAAFMGLTGSAGAAVVSIEGGGPCPATVAEGEVSDCPVHGTANDLELGGPFGVMIVCDVELEGYASASGIGWGTYTVLNEGNCSSGNAHPCAGDEQHVSAEITGGADPHWDGTADLCADVESPINLGEVHCTQGPGEIVEHANHNYSIVLSHNTKCPSNPAYSLSGVAQLTKDSPNHVNVEVSNN